MAQIYYVYRVTPSREDVNYEKLKQTIKGKLEPKYQVKGIEEEEIGFGIKALKVHIVIPESDEYTTDEIENILSQIEDIGGIELEYFTRVSF